MAPGLAYRHDGQPPRKKLRKGTHSCLPCRNRKARCKYSAGDQACEGCLSRNLNCVDQQSGDTLAEVGRKRTTSQKRDAELEVLVGQVLQRLTEKDEDTGCTKEEQRAIAALAKVQDGLTSGTASANSKMSAELLSSEARSKEYPVTDYDSPFPKGPVMTFIDGRFQLLSEGESAFVLSSEEEGKADCIQASATTELRALIPSSTDLKLILGAGQSGWRIWQKAFPDVAWDDLDSTGSPKADSILLRILQAAQSPIPTNIAKLVLCISLNIQQLPLETNWSLARLPTSSSALEKHYLNPVGSFLASDEKSACTVEGLECMMVQTRLYINIGKPLKAWLVFRRAVSIAHLLGLHRQSATSSDRISTRKRGLWLQIWQGERYLSLIFGLSHSVSDEQFDLESYESELRTKPCGEQLLLRISVIAGCISQRDHNITTSNRAPDPQITLLIEQKLETARISMPEGWWETMPNSQMSLEAITDMTAAKFAFSNVKKLLYLPFVLHAGTDPCYERSRTAILDASREMIMLYLVMRDDDRPLFHVCYVADFQVFTAALVLVLDLLDYGRPFERLEGGQRDGDWRIINNITECFTRIASKWQNNVAAQAAKILEDLVNFNDAQSSDGIYEASIPYFGKILIKRKLQSKGHLISSLNTEGLPIAQENTSLWDTAGDSLVLFDSCVVPLEDPSGLDWMTDINFDLCGGWDTLSHCALLG
jgi:hypothetical protein